MIDAYIYIRFSTPRQERGSSEGRQLEDCRAFAERQGWNVADVVKDLGRSAWKGDHLRSGNLGKFATAIFEGEVAPGVIVVENLDRLSRQKPRITQRWMEDVCARGFKIATVKSGKVYDAESLEENIMDIFDVLYQGKAANDYVETLSTRVKASYKSRLEKAREDNRPISTNGPAWLEPLSAPPWWEPRPERKRIITEIFNMAVDGHAPWAIARVLNERGERSFTGKKWERTSIVKIIRNRAIEGDYVVGEGKNQKPTGEVLFGYYGEPLLPLDVIAEARAMLDRRRINSKGRNSGAVNSLFGKSIRCGKCGGRMMQMGFENRYLTCYEAMRGNGCDQKSSFRYRPFEAAALDRILPLALDDRFFRQAEKASHIGTEIATIQKAIRDTQTEAEHAYDLHLRLKSPIAERRLVEAEAKLKSLQESLQSLENSLTAAHGVATAQAHLQRVHGFREALSHPGDDIRLPARLRAAEAIAGIGAKAFCRIIDGERFFDLKAVEVEGAIRPMLAFRFDNEGNEIAKFDAVQMFEDYADSVPLEEMKRVLASSEKPKTNNELATFLVRRARDGDPEARPLREKAAKRFG